MISGSVAAAAAAATGPSWGSSELIDPIYGGSLKLARIDTGDVEAVVRCSRGAGYSEVRFFLDPELVASSDSVAWQFDGDAARTAAWDRSANGRSLVVPVAMQNAFIERLKDGRMLRLYLKDARGDKRKLDVPLRGSGRAITAAMQDCPAP